MSRLPDFSAAPARAVPVRPLDRAWLAAGALLLLAGLGAGLRAQQDLDLARRELERARAGVRPAVPRRDPAQPELQERARRASQAPPPQVLARLEALLPPGVRFESISLAYEPEARLELAVRARGARDYDRFLEALEASAGFADIVPGRENRDGELRTSLALRYVPEAGPRPSAARRERP